MVSKLMILSVLFVGLFLSACQTPQSETNTAANTDTSASGGDESKPDPKSVEEVKEMLTKHDKALNDKNIEELMATFSTDSNTVTLGTGAGERFVGPEAIKSAYTEIFKGYDQGTMKTTCEWKTGGIDPSKSMAWLAATCLYSDSLKDVKREYVMNASAVVVKKDNTWKFEMLHLSNSPDLGPPPADAPKK